MFRQLARFLVAAAVPLAGTLSAEALQAADPPTAAELVQGIIDSENKIDDVESLYLRFEGKWTHTPEQIAKSRAELQKQFPGEVIEDHRFSHLWPEMTEELVLAFDRQRVRFDSHWHKSRRDVRVYDGTRAIAHAKYFTHPQEDFVFRTEPHELYGHFTTDLSWLRVGTPTFWFVKEEYSPEVRAGFSGLPEDYELAGEETIDGRRCYVLRNFMARRELRVGKDDGRAYRSTTFVNESSREYRLAARKAAGRDFANDAEEKAWFKSLSEAENEAYVRQLMRAVFPLAHRYFVHDMSDYREVKPGIWIPFTQSYELLCEEETPRANRELRLVEARVDEPLADDLFRIGVEPPDGARIIDYTHDPPLFYKQKADRTPEEFQALVEEHKRDNEDWAKRQAARDALIGKPAPELPQSYWLNSDKLDWAALKGKVVLLDFWSVNCGPCRNDLPHVERMHQQREESGIVVIGVHSDRSTKDEVAEFAKEMKLNYPIAIDTPPDGESGFGQFFVQVQVNAIPYSLLVDRDGKVAAHGRLSDVVDKARKLAAAGGEAASK